MTTDDGFVSSGALGRRGKGFIVTACALPTGAAGLTSAGGSEFSGGLGNRGKPFISVISLAFHRNRASAAASTLNSDIAGPA